MVASWILAFFMAAEPATQAYEALHTRNYDSAVALFLTAIEANPENAHLRKDLAYAYLKVGENEAARDQFAEAWKLDPTDYQAALEYAFLCYETQRKGEARRVFNQIRQSAPGEARRTAEEAFQNIDRSLAERMELWKRAVEAEPDNFSAHRELGEIAEERDELALAAEHYLRAWRLRPDQRALLLALGRVWKRMGRDGDAVAVLLAASRGAEPRVAEAARGLLPDRYPYVYEFREALALDPTNVNLHRELAYLLLAMQKREEAEAEFLAVVKAAPNDLLSVTQLGFLRLERGERDSAMPLLERVLASGDKDLADRVRFMLKLPRTMEQPQETPRTKISVEAKAFADKSFELCYWQDAWKYYLIAHEKDPLDFDVILRLGWTGNAMGRDKEALPWFDLARRSPRPEIAAEAERAWRGLASDARRFRISAWLFPIYSSRWRNTFSYGQIKMEWRARKLPFRPYLSTRFIGDSRGILDSASPHFFSESAFVIAAGVSMRPWKSFTAWGEAGTAASYRTGKFLPDYRGGLSFSRRTGARWFHAFTGDAVFLSRFDNDVLVYLQHRTGRRVFERAELYWNYNATADAKRQTWANFVETGPGVALRLPSHVTLSLHALRGRYLRRGEPTYTVNYTDFRAGLWYAFLH